MRLDLSPVFVIETLPRCVCLDSIDAISMDAKEAAKRNLVFSIKNPLQMRVGLAGLRPPLGHQHVNTGGLEAMLYHGVLGDRQHESGASGGRETDQRR